MDNRPIGVFDSGLGGLTAVRQLTQLLPGEDIVYFGDTGRVPYGTRSEETICRYAVDDCRLLLQQDVKCIIAACGTVSSVAPHVLQNLPVPAFGVVEATAKAAARATKNRKIGILGTSATVRSGSFVKALQSIDPSVETTSVACSLFVPLVENGWIRPEDEVTVLTVQRYMKAIREAEVDTVILGCTHFPLLAPIIQKELGNHVCLIDSGKETALCCFEKLKQQDALARRESGQCHYYVSDRVDGFSKTAAIFLGHSVDGEVTMLSAERKG